MSTHTHCMPSGSLGTNEIPVCNVGATNVASQIPAGGLGSGNIRGIIVAMHGLSVGIEPIPPTISTTGSTVGYFEEYGPDFSNNMLADGWIVLSVSYPEDFYVGIGATAIWNDINSDSGNGLRYLNTQLHWWDHVIDYIRTTYGPAIPIVPFGGSWGGYHTLMVASYRASTIIAYCSDIPATILANANPVFTNPANYGASPVTTGGGTILPPLPSGTGGLDLSQTALNAVNIPGLVTYGTNDGAIGWAIPGFGSLSPLGGTASNAYIASGIPYNNVDMMIINAQSFGMPVTRNQTSNGHDFTTDDAGYTATFTPTGPTALSSLSTLYILNTLGGSLSGLTSGQTAIFASDNVWHVITFTQFSSTAFTSTAVTNVAASLPSTLTLSTVTGLHNGPGQVGIVTTGAALVANYTGVSGSTITGVSYVSGSGNIAGTSASIVSLVTPLSGCTYSGTTSATVSNGASVCKTGSPISGGYNTMALPYWFAQNVDTIAPRAY